MAVRRKAHRAAEKELGRKGRWQSGHWRAPCPGCRAAVSLAAMGLVLLALPVLFAVGALPASAVGQEEGAAASLQELIDAASAGASLTPPAGTYSGPIVITKPMTLDGSNGVVVDGGGKGTVIHIRTDGATVRDVHVTNSGDQHNDIDAGIRIEGNFNVVKDNTIDEALFGIDLQQASNNVVRRNRIGSKSDADLGVKGDAVRLWYAAGNRIEENTISGSRDFVVWYSSGNTIARNDISYGRYGIHFMYARDNVVEGNRLNRNAVGISLMYDEGDIVRDNRIVQAQGATGIGIGLKEASNVIVEGNEVLYNAVGLSFDLSPFQPGSTVRVQANTIAFNDVGISFLSNRPGIRFQDNRFLSNTQHVAMRGFESAAKSMWNGNHWDDYEGFDQDSDGVGDRSYVMRSYSDRLWMDVPNAAFFKGSPALSVLDFIERLAPFTEPLLLLQDDRPRMSKNFQAEAVPQMIPAAGSSADDVEPSALDGAAAPQPSRTREGRLDPFGLYSN